MFSHKKTILYFYFDIEIQMVNQIIRIKFLIVTITKTLDLTLNTRGVATIICQLFCHLPKNWETLAKTFVFVAIIFCQVQTPEHAFGQKKQMYKSHA